jgi:malonate-semialdehyde dehydrogenase (acetylating)/methylmalonate-semialdehyde dehydrogenase
MKRITHWISGKPWDGEASRSGAVFDPATGAQSAEVDFATEAEVAQAVAAAKAALSSWSTLSLTRRTQVLFRFRQLLEDHGDEIASIISSEHGKVHADALGEVSRGLEVVEFACGISHLIKGEMATNVSTNVDAYSVRHSLGVVAGITPFNFPAMVPLWMIPIALACGNTFVLKPSEKDPSASVRLAELWAEAGLPDGALNVVHGDKVAVDALLGHPDVQAVSFVGSTPIARYIYETAAKAGKRVQALGGAKNHMVVLPDADLDAAADAMVSAGFGSAGERCMAVSVVVAVGSIADELIQRALPKIHSLRVAPASDPEAEMGPLVTAQHRARVASYLDAGVAEGATLVVDGRKHDIAGPSGGFWLGPTLFDHVRPEMSIYTDEIFGPVLSVVRVDTFDEALALIRANRYGNGAAIFTTDGGAARRFEEEADAGMIGINVPIPVPMAYFGFGGFGDSLFGDLDVYGPDGVRFYTRPKKVTSRWLAAPAGGAQLHFPTNN